MSRLACLGAAAVAVALGHAPCAAAHVIVGPRLFPVTLTFDDPGVADEATLSQVSLQPADSGTHLITIQWEYDKTITPTTALIYNQGFDILAQRGDKTRMGFENVALTAKWQAYTNADTETVVSLGVIREFGGGYATQQVGGDAYGSTSPTLYGGQGGGFLPVPLLRPLAVTGEASYVIPDRRLNSDGDNNGNPAAWAAALSVQYSLGYLQAQVRDYGLPDVINRMIPLVEVAYTSPASGPAAGVETTLQVAPGVIYVADTYQVGVEMLIPANRATGTHPGVTAQFHVFLDDLLPGSVLGRPIFQ